MIFWWRDDLALDDTPQRHYAPVTYALMDNKPRGTHCPEVTLCPGWHYAPMTLCPDDTMPGWMICPGGHSFRLGSPVGIHFIWSHTLIWISWFVYILDLCTFKASPLGRFENCSGQTKNVPKLLRDPFFRDPLCGTLWSGTLWSGTLWYVIRANTNFSSND